MGEAAGGRIVDIGAIGGIDRRGEEFIAQAEREREVRMHLPRIVEIEIVAFGAQVLRVIETRHAVDGGNAEQQVCDRIAGDRAEESEEAAGFDIAERFLPLGAEVRAELERVTAAHPRGLIEELQRGVDAALRIDAFITDGRIAIQRDEAQAEIARIGGNIRQADLRIDAGALPFLIDAAGHAAEAEAKFIEEGGREGVCFAEHQVLRAARDEVAVTGDDGVAGTAGKRLEEIGVAEAVARGEFGIAGEAVVGANVEVVFFIALRGGGDEVNR